jgi:cysteinyl-tRNA synthetase
MTIRFYNTLTRRKEPFEPLDPARIRLYVCGPTVYDAVHIGNARTFVAFDVIARLLRHVYGENHVVYVRNITDVDDKINAAAKAKSVPIADITTRTTALFHEDMKALACRTPDIEPRATDHIPQMIAMAQILITKEHAYVGDGHVLFDVNSMSDYGALSRRSLDDMIAGARVEVAPYKRNPMDFVLWKPSAGHEPGWESPWGRGRPGWHLECSAMTETHLGESFDIHGGGADLVFPHHENEIAQSQCAHNGTPMARFWLHCGYLQVDGEKMSKSLGNFYTVQDLRKEWPGEALRLQLLMAHYRQPLNWTLQGLRETKTVLDKWYRALGVHTEADLNDATSEDISPAFLTALSDDANTPEAIAILHALARDTAEGNVAAARALRACGELLGVFSYGPTEWAAWRPAGAAILPEEIERLIEARNAARRARNFAEADRLRDELTARGVMLEDSPRGTSWRFAP